MEKTIDVGKVSEYAFAAELLDRNIVPCWPSTEMSPYDMIADTGKARYRIQVKGTRAEGAKIAMDLRRPPSTRKKNGKYKKSDTDFIIAHVVEFKAWYIFPVEEVNSTLTLQPGNGDCKYAKYLAAWHLLDPRLK